MRSRPSLVAVAVGTIIAVLAAAGAGAHAEAASTNNGFAKRLFAGDAGKQEKSYACFVRACTTPRISPGIRSRR